jgi:hypothetical protein
MLNCANSQFAGSLPRLAEVIRCLLDERFGVDALDHSIRRSILALPLIVRRLHGLELSFGRAN